MRGPSAAQLRPKSGKTTAACAWQGIGNFCRSGGQRDTCAKSRTYGTAQVLWDLQRKGYVRQRSIAADLTFWLLLGQAKSDSPRGN